MKKFGSQSQNFYLETKLGIVTQTGNWFHTTSEHIHQFVPGLLDERSLDQLVKEAIAWVRSADSLALTLLLVLLLFIPPVLAAVITVAFHFFWYRLKSGFVTTYVGRLLTFMNTDGYLLIVSLVIISYIGMQGNYLGAVLALVFFFLMKLGLLKHLWDKIDADNKSGLSLNDRVFKMVLVKNAMHYNITPKEVQKMEDTFVELYVGRKEGKE